MSAESRIRLLSVDDHPLMREGIAAMGQESGGHAAGGGGRRWPRGYSPISRAPARCHSEETVKVHVKHIMEKLGAKDRTDAVAIALRRGIIQL